MQMTMQELAKKLGRQPSINEWRIANGKEPIKKLGRKARKIGSTEEEINGLDVPLWR
jgi:hypothetical protein